MVRKDIGRRLSMLLSLDSEIEQKLTPRAQQVLSMARKEADRFNHNFCGTKHVLLGLIKLRQGVAFSVLVKPGLDLDTVRLEVEKEVGVGPDQKYMGPIPYTPRVKKVISLAVKEARTLNHTYVSTEHLLLGLLLEGDGIAARVLKDYGVELESTRARILRELDPEANESEEAKVQEAGVQEKPPLIQLLTQILMRIGGDQNPAGLVQTMNILKAILSEIIPTASEELLVFILNRVWTGDTIVSIIVPILQGCDEQIKAIRRVHNNASLETTLGRNVALVMEVLIGQPVPKVVTVPSMLDRFGLEVQSATTPTNSTPTPSPNPSTEV